MELRAIEDIPIGVDVTPWIPPLAHCLHIQFLSSHCSSCFCTLSSIDNRFPCPRAHPSCPIIYCSSDCSSVDSTIHVSSGECHLISTLPSDADLDATNLRLALRLAFLLEPSLPVSAMCPDRIGGLMTNRGRIRSLDRQVEEIKLLSLARKSRDGDNKCGVEAWLVDAALCAVLTNAVEVVPCTRKGPIGAAVYPPSFSWFNHDCAPNALFRFKLFGGCHSFGRSDFLVEPYGGDNTVIKSWPGCYLRNELKLHGPRVIARSIRSIRKRDEVCITYIDPLLPKGIRQSELQESYLFLCGCHRCSVSPPAYVDRILQGNENSFVLCGENVLWMSLNAYIQQSINKYRVDDDPEEGISSIEAFLLQLFNNEQNSLVKSEEGRDHRSWLNKKATLILQLGAELSNQYEVYSFSLSSFVSNFSSNNGPPTFDPNQSGVVIKNELECNGSVILHPMHYLLINSYISLASAYRVISRQKLANGDSLEAFRLLKAVTAYSLLLAGGVHFMYTLEPSLIPLLVEQWVDSGTSLLELSKGSASDNLYNKTSGKAISCDHLRRLRLSEASTSEREFNETYEGALICLRDITTVVWPFLIEETPCLNFIRSPMDFGCLEKPEESIAQLTREDNYDIKLHLLELGVHCLLMGKYLGSVCYGFDCQLVTDVEALLRVV